MIHDVVISASSDRTVRAWNPHDPESHFKPHAIGTHDDYVKCLALAPAVQKIFSGGFDRSVKLWDLNDGRAADGEPIFQLGGNGGLGGAGALQSSVYALATDEAARTIAIGTTESPIAVWDTRSRKQIARLVGHTNNVKSLLLSADGQHLLSGSSDSTIRLWSIPEQRCLHTFEHHNDSVWSLYSDHPELDVFYSGDRQGYVCKVDWSRMDEVGDGECVVLCRDVPPEYQQPAQSEEPAPTANNGTAAKHSTAAAWSKRHKQLTHSGIHKIVAAHDAYFFTASSSSSVKMWEDVPRRSDREALYHKEGAAISGDTPTAAALADDPASPFNSPRAAIEPAASSLRKSAFAPSSSPRSKPAGVLASGSPAAVSFAEPAFSSGDQTSIDPLASGSPGTSNTSPLANARLPSSPLGRASRDDNTVLMSSPSIDGVMANKPAAQKPSAPSPPPGMNGIPFSALVSLDPSNDLYGATVGLGSVSRRKSSIFGLSHAGDVTSGISMLASNYPRASLTGTRPAEREASPRFSTSGAAPFNPARLADGVQPTTGTPTTSLRFASGTIDERHTTSPIAGRVSYSMDPTYAPHTDSMDPATTRARLEFEERELAEDAIPLHPQPVDVIQGDHGLIRSSMLNDRRHIVTIDTAAEVAIWDIVQGRRLGAFDASQVRATAEEELAPADHLREKNQWQIENHSGEVLDLVRDRVEGAGATPLWCTADTRAGQLTIHLQEPRCFDAELYLDEAPFVPDGQYNEDQRSKCLLSCEDAALLNMSFAANVGKWVLRNLFDKFVRVETQVRGKDLPRKDLLAAEDPDLFRSTEGLDSALAVVATPPKLPTPGQSIGLASPAKSPAIISQGKPYTPGSLRGLDQLMTSLKTPRPESSSDYFAGTQLGLAQVPDSSDAGSIDDALTPLPATPSGGGIFGRFKRSKTKSEKNGGKRVDGQGKSSTTLDPKSVSIHSHNGSDLLSLTIL
jgi:WD repeat-containing protein 48